MLKLFILGFLFLTFNHNSDANDPVVDADWIPTPTLFSAETSSVGSFYEFFDCLGWKQEQILEFPRARNIYLGLVGFDKEDGKKEISLSVGAVNRTTPPFELSTEFEETLLSGHKSKTIVVHSPRDSRYRFVMTQKLEDSEQTMEHVFLGNNRLMHVVSKCCKKPNSNCQHLEITFDLVKYY